MPIHNILVAFNGSEASVSALKYAAALAQKSEGHVTAVLVHAARQDYSSESRWISKDTIAVLAAANEEILSGIESGFDEIKDQLGLGDRIHFRRLSGRVDAELARFARSFDLAVIGRYSEKGAEGNVSVHPDRVAMISGRPVLIVPPGYDMGAKHDHAVIAWDGGRAAARALSDAMDMLECDGQVTLLTVGDGEEKTTVDLVTHLSRHDVRASAVTLPSDGGVGATILGYCAEHDPQLLVMGAYEHSKFQSELLGGVTSEVTSRSSVPILLAH